MNRRSVLGMPAGLTMLSINTDLVSTYSRRRRDRTSFDSIEYDNAQLLDYQHPAPQAHQDPDQEIDLLNDDSNLPLPPRIPPPPAPPPPAYKQAGQWQQTKGTTPLRVLNLAGYTDGENKLFYPACSYKCGENGPLEKKCSNNGSTNVSCVCANTKLLDELGVCVKLECVHYGGDMEKFWKVMGRDCGRIGIDLDRKSTPELREIYNDTARNTPVNTPASPKTGESWVTSPSTPRLGSFFSNTPTTPRPGTSLGYSPSTPRPATSWGASPSTPRHGTLFTNSPTTTRPGTAFSLLSKDTSTETLPEGLPLVITVTKTVSVEFKAVSRKKSISSADYRTVSEICFHEPRNERVMSKWVSNKEINYSESIKEKYLEEKKEERAKTPIPMMREGPGFHIDGATGERKTNSGINVHASPSETVELLKRVGVMPKKVFGAVKKVRNIFGRVQT